MLRPILRRHALFAIGLLAGIQAGMPAAAESGYVDPVVCAGCHTTISRSFGRTGMARSFRAVIRGDVEPEFDGSSFFHDASRELFRFDLRDGIPWIRRSQAGPSGGETNVFEERVDYVVGSGNEAISFLHRTRDNKLVEFPVSWYPERGGHWGMSPAYDRPDHPGFSREVNFGCMACHNAYPDSSTARTGASAGESVFPERLPEGIDCQRCHGPGRSHVDAASRASTTAEIRTTIVNPARLGPDRQDEVCLQCHLETTSSRLPASLFRAGRGIFSYRPGEALADSMVAFDRAPGAVSDDSVELVSAPVRLAKSKCMLPDGKALSCTTCHDPHVALSREESVGKTETICASCHRGRIATMIAESRHTGRRDCVQCHMLSRKAADVMHAGITDHWIQKPHDIISPVREINARNVAPYGGEVVLDYPKELAPGPDNDVVLAMAEVQSNPGEALRRLGRLSPGDYVERPDDAAEIGHAYLVLGQPQKAETWYRMAQAKEANNQAWLAGLGNVQLAERRPDLAADTFAKVAALAPNETDILLSLGSALAQQGKLAEAILALREAVNRNPESAAAFNDLGSTLLRAAETQTSIDSATLLHNAEEALREAVRIQPEFGSLRMNLANAFIKEGKFREAQEQLEEAIRTGGYSETAESTWFSVFLATGSAEQALKAWNSSFAVQTAGAHNNLGTVFASENKPDDALREYRLAVQGDPQSALAQFNLGLTLWGRKLKDEATPHLQKAAEMGNPGIRSAANSLLQK